MADEKAQLEAKILKAVQSPSPIKDVVKKVATAKNATTVRAAVRRLVDAGTLRVNRDWKLVKAT
jgi:hypothetical protein